MEIVNSNELNNTDTIQIENNTNSRFSTTENELSNNISESKSNHLLLFEDVQTKLISNFLKTINKSYFCGGETIDFGELNFFLKDKDYLTVKEIVTSHSRGESDINNISDINHFSKIDKRISRAISSFICAGIGDALGTHMEFSPVQYDRKNFQIKGFNGWKTGRCNLGEFSDDTSMALCVADSIFYNNFVFNGADMQIKFLSWWNGSYNNCLKPRRHSFGLGGNISTSLGDFERAAANITDLKNNLDKLPQCCNYSDKNANGNGSLMRNASVPITFASNPELFEYGKKYTYNQSKVTHTGDEAAECCRLLTHLVMKLINNENSLLSIKESMEKFMEDFQSENYSVQMLNESKLESESIFQERMSNGKYDPKFSKSVNDRNWNWKDVNFRYSPTREKYMPGYIGSYCMDALAMALHLSYYSTSAEKAVLIASNLGGDCDSVAAIVGQIVGAFYGLEKDLLILYEGVSNFDNFKLAYMAYKLFTLDKNIKS